MKRSSAALGAVFAMTVATESACFYPRGWNRIAHQDAYIVDVVVIVVGALLFNDARDRSEDPRPALLDAGVSVAGGLGALVNLALLLGSTTPDPVPAEPSEREDPEHDARTAADAGNCPAVREAMVRLMRRDRDRASEVVTLPAIRRCFLETAPN
jgi:hypothetical protein